MSIAPRNKLFTIEIWYILSTWGERSVFRVIDMQQMKLTGRCFFLFAFVIIISLISFMGRNQKGYIGVKEIAVVSRCYAKLWAVFFMKEVTSGWEDGGSFARYLFCWKLLGLVISYVLTGILKRKKKSSWRWLCLTSVEISILNYMSIFIFQKKNQLV